MTTNPVALHIDAVPHTAQSDGIILDTDQPEQVTLALMGIPGVSVSGTAFAKALHQDIRPFTGLLPPGIRWVSRSRKTWLFEQPPMTMTINHTQAVVDEIAENTEQESYVLSLPHLAYLVDLDTTYYPDSIFVYALQHPIESIYDHIGVLPLSNFSSAGKLCQPERAMVGDQPTTVGEGLVLAYSMVWASGFNLDLNANYGWCRGLRQPALMYDLVDRLELDVSDATSLMRAWGTLTAAEVQAINDWPMPRHFYRHHLPEDYMEMYSRGREMQSVNSEDPRPYYNLRHALNAVAILDRERSMDGGPEKLRMTLQGAMSQAALYE